MYCARKLLWAVYHPQAVDRFRPSLVFLIVVTMFLTKPRLACHCFLGLFPTPSFYLSHKPWFPQDYMSDPLPFSSSLWEFTVNHNSDWISQCRILGSLFQLTQTFIPKLFLEFSDETYPSHISFSSFETGELLETLPSLGHSAGVRHFIKCVVIITANGMIINVSIPSDNHFLPFAILKMTI